MDRVIRIIGITGLAQSGKDTLASFLQNKNHNIYILPFAKALKDEIKYHIEKSKNKKLIDAYNNMEKNDPLKRWIYQTIGTEYGRDLRGQDYWICKWCQKALKILAMEPAVIFVVPDVRFQNEYDFIKECGGVVIKVKNNRIKKMSHVSENDNIPYDYVIANHGTLSEYISAIEILYFFMKEEIEWLK